MGYKTTRRSRKTRKRRKKQKTRKRPKTLSQKNRKTHVGSKWRRRSRNTTKHKSALRGGSADTEQGINQATALREEDRGYPGYVRIIFNILLRAGSSTGLGYLGLSEYEEKYLKIQFQLRPGLYTIPEGNVITRQKLKDRIMSTIDILYDDDVEITIPPHPLLDTPHFTTSQDESITKVGYITVTIRPKP